VAGYRPCLICRPDHLPIVPIRPDSDPVVAAALVRIAGGALDRGDEATLGHEIGVSARHLRRLFVSTVGATPAQVARSRRAHFARLLLDDTDLPITEIAFASGFGSVRSMNDVVRSIFRRTPSELRRKRRRAVVCAVDGGLHLRIRTPRAADFPRRLDELADGVIAGVESVENAVYRRTTEVCGHPGVIEIAAPDDRTVEIVAHLPAVAGLIDEVARCRRLLRLDHTSAGPLGAWSDVEAEVRTLVHRTQPEEAVAILAELAEAHGRAVPGADRFGLTRVFPSSVELRSVEVITTDRSGRVASSIRDVAEQDLAA
jgi:AraC family transcriptional regulator of adaptative response / DNA-3-methyladenine glycosylase II